jgi:hypothetical protein
MDIEVYEKMMNYINIINDRYIKLINGLNTKGVNIDDIFFASNNIIINVGLVTFRESSPYLIDNYKKSGNIEGGVYIKKNLRVDDLIVNNEDLSIGSIKVNGQIISGNGYVNLENMNTNIYKMGKIDIKKEINSNINIGNLRAIFNISESKMEIINGDIDNCTINVRDGRVGSIGNIFIGNTYIMNRFIGMNISGEILKFNNFNVGNLDLGNIIASNINIENGLKVNNIFSNKHTEITDKIIIKRLNESTTKINNDINIQNITTKNISCNLIKMGIYETPIQIQIPLHRNNDIRFQVTTCSFSFEYSDSYTFKLINNIIFNNPFNFIKMTMFFEDYIPIEYFRFKPNNGLNFIVSGFRSDTINIYSILYLVDYFNSDNSKIHISIIKDENEELSFKAGFVYYINKFNYNYYI